MRKCYICSEPISGCNGSVLAEDFSKASDGSLSWDEVRELCPRCVTNKVLNEDGYTLRFVSGHLVAGKQDETFYNV